MADIYKVIEDKASIRKKKDSTSAAIKTLKKDREVKIKSKEPGEDNKEYGYVKSVDGWIAMDLLSKLGTDKLPIAENLAKYEDTNITGQSNDDYDAVLARSLHAFGSPPMYTKKVDPWYNMKSSLGVGRAMASTWYSDPSILSLCPGAVDYLPGFNRTKAKNKLFNAVTSALHGQESLVEKDNNRGTGGQLYTFKNDYRHYINIVNSMARTAAIFLGIQNEKGLIPGSSLTLGNMDYGYFTNAEQAASSGKGIMEETRRAASAAVNDDAYVHFFVNHSGVQVSESISASSKASWLEEKLGSDSGLSSAAENIQFLFGGAIDEQATKDMMAVIENARTSNEMLGNLGTIAATYLKGGRIIFPKMITGMSYEKSISCELSFVSPYGDKRSIFRYCILPSLHLLAMGTPKQLSGNMYTYPFLIRAFQRGSVNMDLAFMSNLELSRGGSDNTSWTADGLPTEVTARFSITPLYSNMMVGSAALHPLLFMQNSALIEYLGTMCGIDLHMNNLDQKITIARMLFKNQVPDLLTNFPRGLVDSKLLNEFRKFMSITGR